MELLKEYGWNKHFETHFNKHQTEGLEAGRVISVKGYIYTLISNNGETEAELSGRIMFGSAPEELPKSGDWVYFIRYDEKGYITEVFPRINEISRKTPGNTSEKQVIAANIDYAVIVQGLDRDFNLMRLERYLVQITACGIKPVIVLNKSDLTTERENYLQAIKSLGRNCPVYICSTYTGEGIDELVINGFTEYKTYIMLGSSGVGKSSLLNALSGTDVRPTGILSNSTGKGRHTTSTRDLFKLPNGSLLIDTPGMREFGLSFEEQFENKGIFPVIDKFAHLCRYSDCHHIEEEGCAVIDAFNKGEIKEEVYQSYLKLLKEQQRFNISAEERKRMGKQFGKMVREVKDYRKKYKY